MQNYHGQGKLLKWTQVEIGSRPENIQWTLHQIFVFTLRESECFAYHSLTLLSNGTENILVRLSWWKSKHFSCLFYSLSYAFTSYQSKRKSFSEIVLFNQRKTWWELRKLVCQNTVFHFAWTAVTHQLRSMSPGSKPLGDLGKID